MGIKFGKKIKAFFVFKKQFHQIKEINARSQRGFSVGWKDKYPCLKDATEKTKFDAHYVYHVAWAIRKVLEIKPVKHIDISSSLYFCSNLSAFVNTEFYDYRPASLFLSNLSCKKADLINLSFENKSIECLSCMHTVEHVGLGRYGDDLDFDADLRAISELKRVIKPGGHLIFVVPVGQPKVQFNAHRIYSYEQIAEYFKEFTLVEFSMIPDNAAETGFMINADKNLVKDQKYACGCFVFKRENA